MPPPCLRQRRHNTPGTRLINADLIAAAAENGQNILCQHFRVAAGHIDIHVAKPHEAIEHVVQPDGLRILQLILCNGILHLVDEDIIHFF